MIISLLCGFRPWTTRLSSFWQPLLKAGEMTEKKGWPGGFSRILDEEQKVFSSFSLSLSPSLIYSNKKSLSFVRPSENPGRVAIIDVGIAWCFCLPIFPPKFFQFYFINLELPYFSEVCAGQDGSDWNNTVFVPVRFCPGTFRSGDVFVQDVSFHELCHPLLAISHVSEIIFTWS